MQALSRILDARQLGLKFIANVTYGYTSATYSGRMPAVEIADSIVQSGRETLEKVIEQHHLIFLSIIYNHCVQAIRMIEANPKWGAKVVYGDTDSVFVYLRGKTKEQAFRIGQDITDAVTAANPPPIKLKFEKVSQHQNRNAGAYIPGKVYLPCVLLAKKRYVGFKYENPDDLEPLFDAKGIETVRRDGVLAQQKMTEACLKSAPSFLCPPPHLNSRRCRILFRTQDLSQVKDYCCSSWMKILDNRASIQDFIFAKEVRLGTYR